MSIYSDIAQITAKTKTINEDVDTVYQSISNILNTPITERFFNPEFGSELEDILFEPMDKITEAKIYRLIIDAIDRWEPRVTVDYGRSIVVSDVDNHKYDVTLVFSIEGLGTDNFYFSGVLQQND